MEKATPSRTHDAEVIHEAIRDAIASMPVGTLCAACGMQPPSRVLVLWSPEVGALTLHPLCAACAADPALAVFDSDQQLTKEMN